METYFPLSKLIAPLFLLQNERQSPVEPSTTPLADQQLTLSELIAEVSTLHQLGIRSVLIYPLAAKDPALTESRQLDEVLRPDYFLFRALVKLKEAFPANLIFVDICTCHFLSSGQCGIRDGDTISNRLTSDFYRQFAPLLASSGVDCLCISSTIDGVVGCVRTALDKHGFAKTSIVAQSAKVHSGLYGPFQSISGGVDSLEQKKSYQLNAANRREMLRELRLDQQEGSDMAIIKPSNHYTDLLASLKGEIALPLLGYTTGAEFLMFKETLAEAGADRFQLLNRYFLRLEQAGFSAMISYLARDYAELYQSSVAGPAESQARA